MYGMSGLEYMYAFQMEGLSLLNFMNLNLYFIKQKFNHELLLEPQQRGRRQRH